MIRPGRTDRRTLIRVAVLFVNVRRGATVKLYGARRLRTELYGRDGNEKTRATACPMIALYMVEVYTECGDRRGLRHVRDTRNPWYEMFTVYYNRSLRTVHAYKLAHRA